MKKIITESQLRRIVKESIRRILCESLSQDYGFTPTDAIPEECIDYIISNIEDFDARYGIALKRIGRTRNPLEYTDYELFEEICDLADEWCDDNDWDEITVEDIEEVFG